MEFRPSFTSFLGSFFYGLTPLIIPALLVYFLQSFSALLLVLCAISVLLSFGSTLVTVLAYSRRLRLDEIGIRTEGPFVKTFIPWSEVIDATLRERVNVVSRTDRLLTIRSDRAILTFNTDTLSPAHEEQVLTIVESKTRLVVLRDKPTI